MDCQYAGKYQPGDIKKMNPHLYIIVNNGCFYGAGRPRVCTLTDHKIIEEIIHDSDGRPLSSI